MALKDWFRSSGGASEQYGVDDLIALGRLEEAEDRLRARTRANPRDLHARLRLADLLFKRERRDEALDEYMSIADSYAREGFYDKSVALLTKLVRLLPHEEKLRQKMRAIERAKSLEHRRDLVIDGLMERRGGEVDTPAGTSAFALQQLWKELCEGPLIERLSDSQLKRLFRVMDLFKLPAGDSLAAEGEAKPELYLVAHGEIEVRIGGERSTVLRSFGPGDILGDRALFERLPWPADFLAGVDSTLLRLTRGRLEEAMRGDPDPRRMLDALREQRHDHQVAAALRAVRERR